MSNYELYVFFLCFIVFTLLTALFTTMIVCIVKQSIRLIRCGEDDETIKKEYKRNKSRKSNRVAQVLNTGLSVLICVMMLVLFVFSICTKIGGCVCLGNIPSYKVVNSGSMSVKNEHNDYLFNNSLNDQIQTFDLIQIHKLPDEFDLELYDIVVYEVDDILVVHRIVEIEEPNDKHPDERWFTLQGDNVENPDRFPVRYSQMRAIYRGNRIPFIGSFVMFMQSPAGWLCILLIVFAMVATPLVEKKISKEIKLRLDVIIGDFDDPEHEHEEQVISI